jgi:hypothetical protein
MTAADLHRAVATTLAAKRLGTPVFVRYQFHAALDAQAVVQRLAQVTGVVRGWLDQPLERILSLGSAAARHVSLTLECRGGATAVVTWIGTTPGGPGIDLTVLGNHGALYHDFGAAAPWDDFTLDDKAPADGALAAWIDRALRSSRPETDA